MDIENKWSFFVDLDGTIFSKDVDEWRNNLKQYWLFCNEFNVNRFIVTGRHQNLTIDILSEIPLTRGGLVTLNGGLTFLDGNAISNYTFEIDNGRIIHDYLFSKKRSFLIFTKKRIFYTWSGKELKRSSFYIQDYQGNDIKIPKKMKSYDAIIKEYGKVYKFLMYTEDYLPKPEDKVFLTKANARHRYSSPRIYEINPLGVNKGVGVKALVKALNLNKDKLIAIGDGENDIHLFDTVRFSVAMYNGAPALKEVATAVAEDKGFPWALKQMHLLIKKYT